MSAVNHIANSSVRKSRHNRLILTSDCGLCCNKKGVFKIRKSVNYWKIKD